jgi:hypothetical protein
MDQISRLQAYFGERDATGARVDVVDRLRDASDRSRPFYFQMAMEMYGYLEGEYPELDFRRKTGLPFKEFDRRLQMLGIGADEKCTG